MQETNYTAFNPTTVQSKTITSLYDVPPICFGLYVAILREVSKKGIK
jgi:hypothetical protein